jgi:hypothetical protein
VSHSKGSRKSKLKLNNRTCACGREKELSFAGDGVEFPVFSCIECGPDKRNEWALWWSDYRFLWQDNSKWDEPKHKLPCLMGYFCAKYAELYGRSFRFDYATTKPYISKDFIMARRLLAMFDGDAKAARTYVKWVFTFKIRDTNCAIRSVGFFVSQKFLAEYMQAKARSKVLRRSTPLPIEFIEWCLANEPDVFEHQELDTWNDLNFVVTYVKQNVNDTTEKRVVMEAVRRGMLPPGPSYAKLED